MIDQSAPSSHLGSNASASSDSVGSFCLVLHSHLPWLAHHGSWPVGEEWLYQSWANSYLPLVDMLSRLADEGKRDLVTLGLTPVLAAQLDDPYCLKEFQTWLGFWQQRAHELAASAGAESQVGNYEYEQALWSLEQFDKRWSAGGSNPIRALADSGVLELLGGPASHPFQPLLDEPVLKFSLDAGLDDSRIRFGQRPSGIWAPECGYRPGMEQTYAQSGVTHLMVDGPTLLGAGRSTADAWTLGDTNVVAFGRDLDVTYRVWSPKRGYPSGSYYRDFHTYHHSTGVKFKRVTSVTTEGDDKKLYDPIKAREAALADAHDFVQLVVERLASLKERRGGKPGVVVAGYDTELFGHWWHEGPVWLEHVLRLLPEAGVNVTTLNRAIADGAVAGTVSPKESSWGSGKDWSVWDGEPVADMVRDNDMLQARWQKLSENISPGELLSRSPILDQLARQGLLALCSDWAFMVTKDSAANYARERHSHHHSQFNRLASAIEKAPTLDDAWRLVAPQLATSQIPGPRPGQQRDARDYLFGNLDGRMLSYEL